MHKLVTSLEEGRWELWGAQILLKSTYIPNYRIDHSFGDQVQRAIDWADDELPGVRRRLALAEAIEQHEPELAGATVTINEDHISDLSPDEAKQLGKDVAEQLRDSDNEIDEELATLLQEHQNDPYFAEGFATTISPDELADVIWGLNNNYHGQTSDYEQLLASLSGTLGTGTRSTGRLALPDGYAQGWVDVITGPEPGEAEPGGRSQALAILLAQGVYSTDFLDHVAAELYDFERSFGGDPVWRPRADNGSSSRDTMHVWDSAGNIAVDVMPYLMQALGNNPEAAQNFFNQGGNIKVEIGDQEQYVNARLQYMIQERTWRPGAGSDGGAGLGIALETATTTFRDRSSQGRISARIASQTFALIGSQTGEGASNRLGPIPDSPGWHMWEGMRENVANMLADYAPDLIQTAGQNGRLNSIAERGWTGTTDRFGEDAPYGATMNRELMEQLLGTLGHDAEHIEIVMAGVVGASQLRMSVALENGLTDGHELSAPAAILTNTAVPPALENAQHQGAEALGWLLNSAFYGAEQADRIAQQHADLLAQGLDVLTVVPGVAPGGRWSKFVFDQIKRETLNSIRNSGATGNAENIANLTPDQVQQLERNLFNLLLAHGYFDQQYVDEANGGPESTRFSAPPEDAIDRTVDPPEILFGSEAWDEWRLDDRPLQKWVNSLITISFKQALEHGFELSP
ncbi:DUF6571 family protein [Phytoactinopolyspora limicola]|uniref:DUF6571 family protein n=1 Tax=Phytoactinopolyspora limicola TaxID=2715536 RepID=UPI0014094FC5|nr:DUF6571 family protein [Phytoactinopolyspora limicola]